MQSCSFRVSCGACRIFSRAELRHLRNVKADGIGHSSCDDERRNRSHSSAAASVSSPSSSLFLLGFWYSSGTFSLQPKPEMFKKAALLPLSHFCSYPRAPQNSAFDQRVIPVWCSAWSPRRVNVLLSLVPSFLLIWLMIFFLITMSVFPCVFRLPQQKINPLVRKKKNANRRIDESVSPI